MNPVHALQGRSIRSAVLIKQKDNNMKNWDLIAALSLIVLFYVLIVMMDMALEIERLRALI